MTCPGSRTVTSYRSHVGDWPRESGGCQVVLLPLQTVPLRILLQGYAQGERSEPRLLPGAVGAEHSPCDTLSEWFLPHVPVLGMAAPAGLSTGPGAQLWRAGNAVVGVGPGLTREAVPDLVAPTAQVCGGRHKGPGALPETHQGHPGDGGQGLQPWVVEGVCRVAGRRGGYLGRWEKGCQLGGSTGPTAPAGSLAQVGARRVQQGSAETPQLGLRGSLGRLAHGPGKGPGRPGFL